MKSPFISAGVTAVLAAGLILSPGLSPASASATDGATSSSPSISEAVGNDSVATTYGVWHLPCSFAGFRWC